MTDEIEPVDTPIVVHTSTAGDQAGSASRDILLIISVLPALIAVLGKRDVMEIVSYLASDAFAPAAGVIVGAAVVAWRQWRARHTKAKIVTLAKAAPDDVAIVVSKGTPP